MPPSRARDAYVCPTPQPPSAPLEPIDTGRLSVVAEICREASAELTRQGYKPDGEKELRRFSLLEVCRYMLPLAPGALRKFLADRPDLPRAEGLAPTFSLEEVNRTRDALPADISAVEQQPHRHARVTGHRVARPEGAEAKTVALCNFKGGVSKTNTAGHLALAAADILLVPVGASFIEFDSTGRFFDMLATTPTRRASNGMRCRCC